MGHGPSPSLPASAWRAPKTQPEVPRVSRWLVAWFSAYSRWYLGRHFHRLRLSVEGAVPDSARGVPTVIYLNHAAWWDPLVCLLLFRGLFPGQHGFAPIDAMALRRYAFFERLGFFGVDPGTALGARQFLRRSAAILDQPGHTLWVTPQGEFADARRRPVQLKPGLAHLAARLERLPSTTVHRVHFLPLALEYTFWEERLPEVLVRFGEPLILQRATLSPDSVGRWQERLEHALEQTQDALAVDAQARDASRFRPLLAGASGTGGVYDAWRRMKAALQGRSFDPRHGRLG